MPYKNKEDRKNRFRKYYLEHRIDIIRNILSKRDPEDNKRRCREWRKRKKVAQSIEKPEGM